MTRLEQHDGFDLVRAAIPACSLDRRGARAQEQRYRATAPFTTNVRQDPMTVVAGFANDLDGAAADAAIAGGHQCRGPLSEFEFDRPAHSPGVTATGAAASPALDPITTGFRRRLTMIFSRQGRRIGPIGTVIRVLAGLALLTLAYLNKPAGLVGGLQLHDLLLGLIALPATSIAAGLLARRFLDGPLRFSGATGTAVNLGVLAVLFAIHYTAGAAALFYGATLLVAAWLGQAGCEFTVLSNACLRRNDEIGCPLLTPIDALELRHRRGRRTPACRPK